MTGAGDPKFCTAWTEVVYSIRWNDDTLTANKVFVVPSDLWNDNCYFANTTTTK